MDADCLITLSNQINRINLNKHQKESFGREIELSNYEKPEAADSDQFDSVIIIALFLPVHTLQELRGRGTSWNQNLPWIAMTVDGLNRIHYTQQRVPWDQPSGTGRIAELRQSSSHWMLEVVPNVSNASSYDVPFDTGDFTALSSPAIWSGRSNHFLCRLARLI